MEARPLVSGSKEVVPDIYQGSIILVQLYCSFESVVYPSVTESLG